MPSAKVEIQPMTLQCFSNMFAFRRKFRRGSRSMYDDVITEYPTKNKMQLHLHANGRVRAKYNFPSESSDSDVVGAQDRLSGIERTKELDPVHAAMALWRFSLACDLVTSVGRRKTEQTEITEYTEPAIGWLRLFRYFRLFRFSSSS